MTTASNLHRLVCWRRPAVRRCGGHIRTQFLSEAILLAMLGGAVGALANRRLRDKQELGCCHPVTASLGGLGAMLLIGIVAGLVPAVRVSRLSPTEAVRRPRS
jgi:putative ABC transport system permease protein